MKIHKIILLSLVIIGFQVVLTGSNFAQTNVVIQELAKERAEEKNWEKKAKADNQAKIEKEKVPAKIKHKEEDKKRQLIQKSRLVPEEPRLVKGADVLDKELKDWLDKLKTIESTLP